MFRALRYAFLLVLIAVSVASAGTSNSQPDVKPVLEVVMGEPDYKETVESLGLRHKSLVSVPEKLQFYSCVVLNNDNVARKEVVGRLKKFIADGGGLVMCAGIPTSLAGSEENMFWGGYDLSVIADWIGCAGCGTLSDALATGTGCSLLTNSKNPMGTSFRAGSALFNCQGSDPHYYYMKKPDELCEIVANWRDKEDPPNTGIAALLHPYGKGWIYWQSTVFEPNYPKLLELFRAGIWRAATGKNLQSGSVSGSSGRGVSSSQGDATAIGGIAGMALESLSQQVAASAYLH